MKSWRVLIVDDEVEFVETLAERLQLRGIETCIANSGEEALAKIESDPPHVLVLDVMMPGLGGLAVLRQIREQHFKVPVILLTGCGSAKEGIEGMRLGAFDYLMKPVDIGELIDKMQEAVQTTQS
jgi:DNA-binding response OmpR family regulator